MSASGELSKNPSNVAGGLKATMNNPRVSEEAKQNAKQRLDQLERGAATEEVQSSGNTGNTSNVIGGYKATISNPHTSEQAKKHAKDVLEGKVEEEADDADYVPEEDE